MIAVELDCLHLADVQTTVTHGRIGVETVDARAGNQIVWNPHRAVDIEQERGRPDRHQQHHREEPGPEGV